MSRVIGSFGYAKQQERAKLLLVLALLLILIIGTCGIFLVISIGTSGGTAKAAITVQKEDVARALVDVLIPNQEIATGRLLEPHLFKIERRAKADVGADAVHSASEIHGMFAHSTIPAHELLRTTKLTRIKPLNPVSPNIPEGYRAVTISVNATSSVMGWALPGSSVDVVWASLIRGKPGVTVIVQNAKVLSAEKVVDPNTQPDAPIPSTVTLLVTSNDALKIQLASTTGSMSLSLRGDVNSGHGVNGNTLTIDELLGDSDPFKGRQRVKNPITVKIRREDGTQVEKVLQNGSLVDVSAENIALGSH